MGSISGFENAVYVQWINGIYQASLGSGHQRINGASNTTSKSKSKYNDSFILLTLFIVLTLVSLFASLNGQANLILGNRTGRCMVGAAYFWYFIFLVGYGHIFGWICQYSFSRMVLY